MKKKKPEDESMLIEFDDMHRPIGPNARKYANYLGFMVRIHININIAEWRQVSSGVKETVWQDLKKEFNISDKERNNILDHTWIRWKDFKTRLVREFINKKNPKYSSPCELYDFLTEEQWEKFVKYHETEASKAKSQKYRELQARNEHPHYLGSRGYVGSESEWLICDPLSSQSSCAAITSTITSTVNCS